MAKRSKWMLNDFFLYKFFFLWDKPGLDSRDFSFISFLTLSFSIILSINLILSFSFQFSSFVSSLSWCFYCNVSVTISIDSIQIFFSTWNLGKSMTIAKMNLIVSESDECIMMMKKLMIIIVISIIIIVIDEEIN